MSAEKIYLRASANRGKIGDIVSQVVLLFLY